MPRAPEDRHDGRGSERAVARLKAWLAESAPADLFAERSGDQRADKQAERRQLGKRERYRGQRKAEDEPDEVADEEESGGAGQSDHEPANADAPACDRPQEIAHATAAGDEPHGQKRGERRRVRRQLDPNAPDDRHWRRKSTPAQTPPTE